VRSVGKGVHEARIDFGPGYRVYFALDGTELILLLGGGEKHGQDDDIASAQRRWVDYKQRKRAAAR
jgi:putative addiction module killer protein